VRPADHLLLQAAVQEGLHRGNAIHVNTYRGSSTGPSFSKGGNIGVNQGVHQ
jgi:hypothetical protein